MPSFSPEILSFIYHLLVLSPIISTSPFLEDEDPEDEYMYLLRMTQKGYL